MYHQPRLAWGTDPNAPTSTSRPAAPETTRGCHGLDGTRRATGGAAATRIGAGVASAVAGSGDAGRECALATRLSAAERRTATASRLVRRIALAGAERISGAGAGET